MERASVLNGGAMTTTQLWQELRGNSPKRYGPSPLRVCTRPCCDLKSFNKTVLDLAEAGQLAEAEPPLRIRVCCIDWAQAHPGSDGERRQGLWEDESTEALGQLVGWSVPYREGPLKSVLTQSVWRQQVGSSPGPDPRGTLVPHFQPPARRIKALSSSASHYKLTTLARCKRPQTALGRWTLQLMDQWA